MITANIKGRLGNQMFQISAAYSLAIDNHDTCVFPESVSGISPTKEEQIFYKKTIFSNIVYQNDFSWVRQIYGEPGFSYKQILYSPNTALDGYFQSEKYFCNNEEAIRQLFSPTVYIEEKIQKYSHLMNDEFVAIHIRRGDYVRLSDCHTNLCEFTSYYDDAFLMLENKKKVFFSDDIAWCKMKFGQDNIFIENENDVVEMYVFSKIPNKIIANSTFSWWGAWLDRNPNVIIAPKMWFGQKNSSIDTSSIIPESWITIA